MGGEVSEWQWTDVIGILKVQGDLLHTDYLRSRAVQLRVDDLLERAFQDQEGSGL